MLWCFTSKRLLYCVRTSIELLTGVFLLFQPITTMLILWYLTCMLVFTMAKIYPLSITSYPDELKVPLLLHQFPSPAGHPPPLNTPSRWSGMARPKVF